MPSADYVVVEQGLAGCAVATRVGAGWRKCC